MYKFIFFYENYEKKYNFRYKLIDSIKRHSYIEKIITNSDNLL